MSRFTRFKSELFASTPPLPSHFFTENNVWLVYFQVWNEVTVTQILDSQLHSLSEFGGLANDEGGHLDFQIVDTFMVEACLATLPDKVEIGIYAEVPAKTLFFHSTTRKWFVTHNKNDLLPPLNSLNNPLEEDFFSPEYLFVNTSDQPLPPSLYQQILKSFLRWKKHLTSINYSLLTWCLDQCDPIVWLVDGCSAIYSRQPRDFFKKPLAAVAKKYGLVLPKYDLIEVR